MSQNSNTEDTIDLKELFFSLIAQWKLIALCVILSLVCALLYLRTTPDTYAVDALVQVEESKGTSAALLGDLSSMIEQKQPAQTEIELLKSRLVLGSVIKDLNLDLKISGTENSFFNRLLSPHDYQTTYNKNAVIFKDDAKSFDVRKFDIPTYYLDKNLLLNFNGNKYTLTDAKTKQVIFSAVTNQESQHTSEYGTWNIALYTQDQLKNTYNIPGQQLFSSPS